MSEGVVSEAPAKIDDEDRKPLTTYKLASCAAPAAFTPAIIFILGYTKPTEVAYSLRVAHRCINW